MDFLGRAGGLGRLVVEEDGEEGKWGLTKWSAWRISSSLLSSQTVISFEAAVKGGGE